LLRELVHHGIWTLRQALAYVRRARSAESRAFGLLELTDFMDERDAAQALRDVEYLSEGVIDPKDRFNLALGVAFRDEAQQRERRMREALAIAGAADEEFDIRSGLMLSWALTAAERRDAEARAIRRLESSDSLDASLLLAVVRGLPSTELDRLARRVERYSNAYDRARGLAILATVEQDDRRARLVTELRRAIETLSAEERPAWHRADALIDMALLVDGEEASTLLDEAEELLERPPAARQLPEGAPWEREIGRMLEAMSGDDRVYIARSYGRLARSRRDRAADYGGKALKVASGVKNAGWRLDALYGVARNDAFPPDIRHSAARRAFAAGARLGTRGEFVGAAGQIAGQLPADDLSRAAAAVQTIGDASVRHHAAAKILICASTSTANRTESVRLLRSACDRVALVRDGHMQTELIRQAAPMADRPGLRTLANATESIESEEWRAVALAELSRWLPRSLRDRATRIAAEIGDDQYGVPLRAGLAARLARDSTRRQKASVVLEESARMGEALAERVPRIRQAGPFDPWPEPGEIFVGAVKALAAIATDETRDALVECVRRFHAAGYRAKALAALAAALPSGPAWELLSETATASTEDGFLAVLEALGETLDGAGLESVIDVALALEDDAAGLAVAIMADRLSLVAAERAALELASRASASANAAHGVGSVLRTLREHGQEAAARRVVAELDKQLGRARTDAARLAKAYAAPWLDRAAKRRTTFWLARRARRAADAANPAAFRWLLPDAVRDRLEERLIPGDDERADPKRACALIVDELPNLRRPDARRRLVRWAASALLAAAPEPRYSALMAIMDSGASDDLPYSARSEAWQAAVEIELPPNRLYALEQLASAPAADEEAHVVQALRVLAEAERPEFLMSLAPIAPLLARRARSPALLVEIVDSAGELWP
jgi:hypothetical protein